MGLSNGFLCAQAWDFFLSEPIINSSMGYRLSENSANILNCPVFLVNRRWVLATDYYPSFPFWKHTQSGHQNQRGVLEKGVQGGKKEHGCVLPPVKTDLKWI